MPIGTVAHETGHAFGLPDLYDTDLNSSARTQGIGEWGLMGSGNYARPYSPARFEAWSLFELGWVDVDTLSSGREVRLGPVASTDTVLYLPIPGTDEFFLLENRQAQESDSAQMNPAFSRHKSPGLLVWHIDQGQLEAHGFGIDNRVNVGPIHGVALVQADGLDDLSRPGGTNRGDAGDAFPGSTGNSSLCQTTTPPARDNQGGFASVCLDGIRQVTPGGAVAFRYVSFHSVFASDHAGARIAVNGTLISRLERFSLRELRSSCQPIRCSSIPAAGAVSSFSTGAMADLGAHRNRPGDTGHDRGAHGGGAPPADDRSRRHIGGGDLRCDGGHRLGDIHRGRGPGVHRGGGQTGNGVRGLDRRYDRDPRHAHPDDATPLRRDGQLFWRSRM